VIGKNPVDAIFSSPNENKKYPAIVYMHGGAVRERGNPVYRQNGDFLFDIKDKIKDMSLMGFVILAPLRNTTSGCCNGDDAVKEGISIAKSSTKYLRSLPNVLKDKVCLLGFSEGALISMWVMTESNDYSKAIIMSPSNQCGKRRAGSKNYCGKHLIQSGKLENIKKEILLTLGDLESRGTINASKGFAEKLSQNIRILEGDHISFTVPREDINSIIKDHCS
jgi:dipeptidyl aminopeptidase/acylaminoacyl peptidase